MNHLTGPTIVRLMRAHGKTIGRLASVMNVSQKRVREVRSVGVTGVAYVQDWMEAITGDHKAGWEEVTRAYV